MLVKKTSIISGKVNSMEIDITQEQLDRHSAGEHIQHVCPHLSPEEREFLINGMSLEEQEDLYGSFSEDDDDNDYDDNNNNGPTGHGDDCYSDADPGL